MQQSAFTQLLLLCLLSLLSAKSSFAVAEASVYSFALTDLGDGDSLVEPGESFLLNVTLENDGTVDLHNVNATLLATSTAILVTDNFQPYGPMPVGFIRDSPSFDFSIPASFTDPNLFFVVTITADEGTWVDIIEIPLSSCSLNFPTDSSSVSWDRAIHSLPLSASGTACTWVASSAQSWISVLSSSGFGSAPFFYEVDSNASIVSRVGQIDLNGSTHTIVQEGFNCDYLLDADIFTFDAVGGNDSLNLSAKYLCPWQAQTSETWITLADPGLNFGSSQINFSVSFNDTYFDRTGYIFIADDTVCIKQRSVACLGVPLDSFDIHVNTPLDESPWDIVELDDGGYLITGETKNYGVLGDEDIFLSKFDCEGNLIWTRTYGTTGKDIARKVIATEVGYLVAGGMTDTLNGDLDAALIFTDFNGNVVRIKNFGGDSDDLFTGGGETLAGDFVFSGYTNSFGPDEDGFIMRTQQNGNPVWSEVVGLGKMERLYYAGEDSGGSLYFCGKSSSGSLDEHGFFTKRASDGSEIWTQADPELGVLFFAGAFTGDGILAVGRQRVSGSLQHVYVSKMDTAGNLLWNITNGGANTQIATNISLLPDNDLMVCGRTTSSDGSETYAYLLKLNGLGDSLGARLLSKQADDVARVVRPSSDGNILLLSKSGAFDLTEGDSWLRKIAANLEDACSPIDSFNLVHESDRLDQSNSIIELSGGGFLITGRSRPLDGSENFDVMLVKTNCNGDTLWSRNYGGPGSDLGNEAVEVEDGYVLTGGINLGGSSFGLLVLKVDFDGDVIWQKVYGGFAETGNDIITTEDKGFLVAGELIFADVPGVTRSNGWLLKLDQHGDTLWTYQNDDPKDDEFVVVIKGGDTIYLAGTRERTINASKSFFIALDVSSGTPTQLWKKFSQDSTSFVDCTVMGESFACCGRVLRTGSTERTIVEKRKFINGAINFRRIIYDGYGRDFAKSLTLSKEGNIVFAGRNSDDVGTPTYGWLYEMNPTNGTEISQQFYTLSGNDVFRKIISSRDSSLVVVGAWQGAPVLESDTIKNWLLKIGEGAFTSSCPPPTWQLSDPGTTDANLSWSSSPLQLGYQLRGGKVGGGTGIVTSPTSTKYFPVLAPASTYYWQVRARCADGIISAFSPLDTFSTLPLVLAKVLPLPAEKTTNDLLIWPNPVFASASAGSSIQVAAPANFASRENGAAQNSSAELLIYDQLGNVLRSQRVAAQIFTVNIAGLPTGTYTLVLQTSGSVYRGRLVVL